jgi:hypothetical protein
MPQTIIQHSFHAGEWAPALNARVDLAKYHAAAATMRNFFVDYRGGASSRMGTKYVLQAYNAAQPVRLIPFQASFTVGYILEFGEAYIRPYYNGAPILEPAKNITGITKANPAVVTSAAHGYSNGNWVYITGVVGMTQINNKYYIVNNVTANTFELLQLSTAGVNSTGYGTYTSGGTVAHVYQITSPFAPADMALIKYAQNVNTMVLCHPNHPPQLLTLNSPTNWTIAAITFGSTVAVPGGTAVATTLAAGAVNYAYAVTAVDANGQESAPSAPIALVNKQDLRVTGGTNTISWAAVAGAVSYNVYKAEVSYAGAVPGGATFGFIGNATGTSLVDSNIEPDFQSTPPIPKTPFSGSGVATLALNNGGSYTTNVVVTIAPPGAGVQATAYATLIATNVALAGGPQGSGYAFGDLITLPNGVVIQAVGVVGGVLVSFSIASLGTATTVIPANPVAQVSTNGSGTGALFNITYTINSLTLTGSGSGYGAPPAVTFSPASTSAATTTIGSAGVGNPSVPTFFQQRLTLASPPGALQTLYMSQPGDYFNFDVHNPIQPDDSIVASLVSGQLNEIKSMISMPSGLILLSNKAAWQVNGGSGGSAVTPADIVANAHAYNGASDVPPIVANFDILYVQSKGSIVRDLTYNFYANIFTGTDISVLSSHLFFGYSITQWAWAEEPFKLVWAVRNDGTLLSLTFLKEQELVGWARHDTNGAFKSVATVTETTPQGSVDAVYFVVQRTVNGQVTQYIERMADRFISNYVTPWCVDAGLQYLNGSPTASFSGMDHLAGRAVVGLADGVPFSTTISATGTFTLANPASTVTVGLAFTPQLQTLALDIGEPTIQGKRKKIVGVSVRCEDTLGLSIGGDFASLVPMKDLVLGNIGSQTNDVVSGLVTGDAWTVINPNWTVQGQYAIQQSLPYPATILGVIPDLVVGDTPK